MINRPLDYINEAEKSHVNEKTIPFWCPLKMQAEVFKAGTSFPQGKLPIKRHVIERMLNIPNHRRLGAARNVAQELRERWVWNQFWDGINYRLMSTHSMGKYYTIPIFHALLG